MDKNKTMQISCCCCYVNDDDDMAKKWEALKAATHGRLKEIGEKENQGLYK